MGINEYLQIGNKIKEIRKSRGLTQREVAKELGVAFSTYSNYENNNREPNFETLKRLSNILDVSIAQLVNDEELAEQETSLFYKFTEYLDELGLSLEQDENDSEIDVIQIVSNDSGTIEVLSSAELIRIFEGIMSDADNRRDRYIINRLSIEFIQDR